jgi:hypothetical protein
MSTIPSESATEPPAPDATEEGGAPATMQRTWSWQRRPQMERTHSITSVMTDSHYAVLPHGVSLEGWSDEDKEALDDHVRHMMHSKRSKFKQRMVAFGKYIQKRKVSSTNSRDLSLTYSHQPSDFLCFYTPL